MIRGRGISCRHRVLEVLPHSGKGGGPNIASIGRRLLSTNRSVTSILSRRIREMNASGQWAEATKVFKAVCSEGRKMDGDVAVHLAAGCIRRGSSSGAREIAAAVAGDSLAEKHRVLAQAARMALSADPSLGATTRNTVLKVIEAEDEASITGHLLALSYDLAATARTSDEVVDEVSRLRVSDALRSLNERLDAQAESNVATPPARAAGQTQAQVDGTVDGTGSPPVLSTAWLLYHTYSVARKNRRDDPLPTSVVRPFFMRSNPSSWAEAIGLVSSACATFYVDVEHFDEGIRLMLRAGLPKQAMAAYDHLRYTRLVQSRLAKECLVAAHAAVGDRGEVFKLARQLERSRALGLTGKEGILLASSWSEATSILAKWASTESKQASSDAKMKDSEAASTQADIRGLEEQKYLVAVALSKYVGTERPVEQGRLFIGTLERYGQPWMKSVFDEETAVAFLSEYLPNTPNGLGNDVLKHVRSVVDSSTFKTVRSRGVVLAAAAASLEREWVVEECRRIRDAQLSEGEIHDIMGIAVRLFDSRGWEAGYLAIVELARVLKVRASDDAVSYLMTLSNEGADRYHKGDVLNTFLE